MESYLFTAEMAKSLGIGASTLRKYASALEEKGYLFERGANNGRMFREKERSMLEEMIEAVSKRNMTIEQAAELTNGSQPKAILSDSPKQTELDEVREQLRLLEAQQKELVKENRALSKLVERLSDKVEERDRDRQLLERLESSRARKKKKHFFYFVGRLFVWPGKKEPVRTM